MSDMQNRLKAIEEQIGSKNTPPSNVGLTADDEFLRYDVENLKWAVGYLALLLRKHLEMNER